MVFRRRVWEIVEVARPGDRASRRFDLFILSLILLNVLAVIVETVPGVSERWKDAFDAFELGSVIVFSVEYLARTWSCVEDERYQRPFSGRLRHALRPLMIVDLLAVAPSLLLLAGLDLRFLRVMRLVRLARALKATRYLKAMRLLRQVASLRKEELMVTSGVVVLLLVTASCLVYYAEHDAQPESFSSIPASAWWAISTLTTVGYGDVYPVTTAGKLLASLVAILGIGLFALPAGILGSGFVEILQQERGAPEAPPPIVCPHCGRAPDEPLSEPIDRA
jgi:voltage-gated potassium channel